MSIELLERMHRRVVGRRRELELLVAALAAGRHVVLEGPPGTGKSTVLRAVADELGLGFEFVEGNAELTPARLVGAFDPAQVINSGYDPQNFVPGPLSNALQAGALLYVEEINRVPEETLNVLITVMSEGELNVPRVGRVVAAPGFRLVAAMNPFDAIGTARISGAIYDRVCRLSMDYQPAEEEHAIVEASMASATTASAAAAATASAADVPPAAAEWIANVVDVVRRTRHHGEVRIGSSVRGAIDIAAVAGSLAALRGLPMTDPNLGLDAAYVALSGRIRVREGASRSAEQIIEELWWAVFQRPDETAADSGKVDAPTGAATPSSKKEQPPTLR